MAQKRLYPTPHIAVRCDGDSKHGTRCTNCKTSDLVCTYFENAGKPKVAPKRTPSVVNPSQRTRELEDKLIKLQTLLSRYLPGVDFSKDLDTILADTEAPVDPHPKFSVVDHAAYILRRATQRIDIKDQVEDTVLLVDNPAAPEYMQGRFFGKSSSAMFVRELVHLKAEYTGIPFDMDEQHRATLTRRPELWLLRPWEKRVLDVTPEVPRFTFPDEDLMLSLIDLYFEHLNLFAPLLHRPTFEKHFQDQLYLRDKSFGAVVLLICAIGAKFSDDPRTFMDEHDTPLTRGWKWFNQVHEGDPLPLSPASLFDVQACSLTAEFLRGASAPNAAWVIVGVGMRLAQDVGAHRWKTAGHQPSTAESELWKRAWWCLVIFDRVASAVTGRPCISQEYDFDVGLPIDCDDEYWDHPDPNQAWKQPEGKPSMVSFFISFIGQSQILASTLDFVYATEKTKDVVFGVKKPEGYEHKLISEMDSALNKWITTIPPHLRWDPNNKNLAFFRQSLILYAELYLLQILIHRPFIASALKATPLAMSSLAICTNAARACSHILNVRKDKYVNVVWRVQFSVFSSALVLLLSVWGGKRAGLATNAAKEMQDVHKCMELLRSTENKIQGSKALRLILTDLASAGDLPLPESPPTRSGPSPASSSSEPPGQISRQTSALEDVSLAGSRRHQVLPQDSIFCAAPDVHAQAQIQDPQPQQQFPLYSIPLHSDDLARLPLFSQTMPSVPPMQFPDPWSPPGHPGTSSMPPLDPPHNLFGPMYDRLATEGVYPEYSDPDPNSFNNLALSTLASDPLNLEPMSMDILDPDILALWSCAPMTLEYPGDQWDAYVSNVNEIQTSSTMNNMHMNMPR